MPAEPTDLADRFFLAIERNDMAVVDKLYADDIVIWHSFDDVIKAKTAGLDMVASLALLGVPRYRVVERVAIGDRLIQRHELIVAAHDGSREYRLNAAIFLTIRDGAIRALDEFLDSRDVTEVLAAIEAARQQSH